jgi:hypothetical protein
MHLEGRHSYAKLLERVEPIARTLARIRMVQHQHCVVAPLVRLRIKTVRIDAVRQSIVNVARELFAELRGDTQ